MGRGDGEGVEARGRCQLAARGEQLGHRRREAPGQRTWLESYELPGENDAAGLLAMRADCAASAGLDAIVTNAVRIEEFDMRGDAPCA